MCREDSPWSSPRWRHVGLRLTRSTRCVLARGRHRQGAGVARGVRVTPPFAAVAAAPPPRALAAERRLRGGPAAVGGRGDVEVGQGAVGGAGRDVGVVRQRRGPAARLFPRPPARGVLTVVPVLVEAPGAPAWKQNLRGAFDATLLDRTSMSASSSKTTPDTPVDVHTGSRVVALCTWSVSSANSRATAAGHLSQNRAAPCVKNASSLTPPGRAMA